MNTSKRNVSNWETISTYVVTYPDGDGEGACDVSVRIGTSGGMWFLSTSDDAGGSDDADETAYPTRESAVSSALDFADERNEAPGEDAESYLTRKLTETAGEPCTDGEWCVYWETVGEDGGPRERYTTEEAATAACDIANKALHACHPGGNLLCGFTVRENES